MQSERKLSRNLSPLAAWAFSIGTSIGWGSLVVTSNTYLAQAGPWGSAIGTVAGGLIMLIISANYAYLMNMRPNAGGAYSYASEALGYDFGFLTAWFLSLTYLAVLWANATSIPLFARYFIGDTFKFGYLYTLFGYDVYLGEALLSIAGGAAGPFAIVVCDLNGLKFVNDTLGHKAGDERLKQASKVICDVFSHSPVFRNGGDEFVAYLSGRDYDDRQKLMDFLHELSVSHIDTGDVVISAGLSVFEKGRDARLRAVFDRADALMYKEKQLLKGMGAVTR